MTRRTDDVVVTSDGVCPTVVVTPDGRGPWPAVLLFMDAGGVRPALVDMAERLAGLGYVAVLPELYYRHGIYEPFDAGTVFGDPDERARLFGMLSGLTTEMVVRDTGALLEFLSGHADVAGPSVGVTGYCNGGGLSLAVAGRYPERIGAAASFHGGNLATDAADSPHRLVASATGRVYVAAATDDGMFPPEQAELLERTLTGAGVEHAIETYPAAHGFAVPDMPTFDAEAAERHWTALGNLLGASLGGG